MNPIAIASLFTFVGIPAARGQDTVRPDRPRLLLTAESIDAIRGRIATSAGMLREYYEDVLADATGRLDEAPDSQASYLNRKVLPLALVYVLGEIDGFDYAGHARAEYGAAGVGWLRAHADRYLTDGPRNDYAASDVYVMSLAYDWLHDAMTYADRIFVAERMVSASEHMEAFNCKYWFSDYTLGCYSYTAAGLALMGDDLPLDIDVWWSQYGDPQHTRFTYAGSSDDAAQNFIDDFETQVLGESFRMWELATRGGGSFQSMLGHSGDLFMWVRLLDAWRTATGEDLLSNFDYLTEQPLWWTHGLVPYLGNRAETPSAAGDALINTDNEPFYSDLLPLHGDSAATAASILTTLAPASDAAALWQWFYANHVVPRYTLDSATKVYRLLWLDDTVAPRSPRELGLPKIHHFGTLTDGDLTGAASHPGGTGIVLMRSAWEEPNATLAIFKPRPFYWLHQDADSNSFAILRKGNLAIDSGKYLDGDWGDHEGNYSYRSIAHNVVHIEDPGESFGSWENDGGQRLPGGQGRLVDNYTVGSTFDIGGPVVIESHADDFDFIESDNTRAYQSESFTDGGNTAKARSVRRKLVYLRSPGGDQDFFVVWDWVEATQPAFRTTWMLHSKYEPQMTGTSVGGATPNAFGGTSGTAYAASRLVTHDKGGRLFVDSLAPAERRAVVRGGPDATGTPNTDDSHEFLVGGEQHKTGDPQYQVCRFRPFFGSWRVEVEDQAAATGHHFLHVLAPRDANGVIVDNADPGFATTGSWSSFQGGLEHLGEDVVRAPGDSGATALWTPDLPAPGQWRVQIVWNDDAGCDGVPVTVHHDGGTTEVRLDQRTWFDGVLAGDWYDLGVFDLTPGTASVEMTASATCDTYQRVQADAVRFIPAAGSWLDDGPRVVAVPSADDTMLGALMSLTGRDRLVMLSRDGERHQSVLYDVHTDNPLQHIVGDLDPFFAYDVFVDGRPAGEHESSAAGVIRFETAGGGAFQITRGAYVNQPPLADPGDALAVTDADGDGLEWVRLDGSGSRDVDGTIVSVRWNEGGTELATGLIADVELGVGTHTIELQVTDDLGATGAAELAVTVIAGDGATSRDGAAEGAHGDGLRSGCCCAAVGRSTAWLALLLLAGGLRCGARKQVRHPPRGARSARMRNIS